MTAIAETTATTQGARDHARAQADTRVEGMPTVPATAWPGPPAGVPADALTWAETVPGGRYTSKVLARGTRLRLRIAAADVMLARGQPQGLSALNILPGIVESVTNRGGAVLVRLSTGAGPILSRITRRSALQLGIAPGEALTAFPQELRRVFTAAGGDARRGDE